MSPHWQEIWEKHCRQEHQLMMSAPVESLLRDIREGRFGKYYTIWRAVAARSTVSQAGWILFSVLETDVDYLYRYHCAAALIKLSGVKDLAPVDLSADHDGQEDRLSRMREHLTCEIGPCE